MRVIGWGSALPDKIVDNQFFADTLDTSDAWIRERTGIVKRRHGGTTSELAIAAGAAALVTSGRASERIDQLVLATTTPDHQIPATAAAVQRGLGLTCGAVDLNAACSGFVYGLVHAAGLLQIGFDTVLLVGAETLTRFTDMSDRSTAVLMGDGAGAVVLTRSDESRLLGFDLGCDGDKGHLLYADIGSTMRMNGSELFRVAVRHAVESAQGALARAGLTAADVDVLVPHQANLRIMKAIARDLGIPAGRLVVTIDDMGNTSAASIPLALDHAVRKEQLRRDDVVLLVGFGAGMTWATAVVRWG